jgi:hypothetical protein
MVERALAMLNSARDAVPFDRVKLLYLRGVTWARLGQWADAEKDFSEAVSLATRGTQVDPAQLVFLARDYAIVLRKVRRKRQGRAIETWEAALHGGDTTSNRVVDITELSPKPSRRQH